jgi:hypothetical protein
MERAKSCCALVGRCSQRAEKRSRRVLQPLLHRRIAFPIRDRIQEFDGIGQESAQAADDEGFEIGSRDPLTLGTVQRGASDEAAEM